MTSWNTIPEERNSLHHFHMFVFLGVHFTAFDVLEYVMNTVSVCVAETRSLSCVWFTFCIMSLNFHWSKDWYELYTSCNVFCMQVWLTFQELPNQSQFMHSLPIIASEHTQQRIWKKTCYTCTLQGPIRCCQNVH